MFDYFQGDPRIIVTFSGTTISVKGGQPVMDQGLENVPLLDLFTEPSWWGNAVLRDEKQRIGSDFEEVAKEASTVTSILKTQAAAQRALQHMVDENLASENIVSARNPSGTKLEVAIIIRPPTNELFALLATRHGPNWLAQRDYPANERI